ncbi:MAG: ATP-binding protein, partial [Xanthobacteraceae bacterium]
AESIRRSVIHAIDENALRQKIAQQHEALENFARVLAHDLSSPIASLQLFAGAMADELSLATIDQDRILDHCREISGAAHRAGDLIDAIFEYTRADAQVEFDTVDMNQVVENAVADLKKLIQESTAQISSGKLPTAVGNAPQLSQLLQNLIANAIKYCQVARPQVRIAARPDRDKAWLFSVKDNGIGIDATDYARIFEPFKRLHGTGVFAGTGLGLATCKKIVERHGGAIWCESVVGEGTTFFFTLAAVHPEPARGSANLESGMLN